MKRIYGVSLLMGILLAAPQVFALTLTLEGGNGYGIYQTGVGGEFTFGISDPTLINNGYFSGANNSGTRDVYAPGSFQTFCVEGTEFINSATPTYTAVYNSVTVFGNVALTKGAAWLYSQFATGGLTANGYNYGGGIGTASGNRGGGSSSVSSAALLQNAIWAFMGQEGRNTTTEQYNPFFNAAIAAEGGTFTAADAAAAVGYHCVYILNLTDSSGKAAQDQLIYTTGTIPNVIPDGGTTALLLGVGMTGLAFVSRRFGRRI